MKKMLGSLKVAPVLLIVLVLALTPLLGVACGDEKIADEMTLIFQSPYPESDVTGLAAKKFKELIEDKTDGKVTLELNFGGILMDHTKQLEGLAAGTVDVVIQHPGYSRSASPNFDFSGMLQSLVTTKAHFQAVASEPTYKTFIENLYNTKGIHFLDYLDTFLGVIYFSKTEMMSFDDWQGKVLFTGRPGSPEPAEAMLGTTRLYVTQTEVATNIANGNITAQVTPITLGASSGDYTNWDYGLVRWFYAPNTMLIAKPKWDAMSPALQELISDTIMPQVADYMAGQVLQANKDGLKKLKDNLKAVHVLTPTQENAVWERLKIYPAFTAKAASMDQTILALFISKRPITTQFGADEKAILTYAGIPIPS